MLMIVCSEHIARALQMEPIYRFELPNPAYAIVACPGSVQRYRWHIDRGAYLRDVAGGDGRPCRRQVP